MNLPATLDEQIRAYARASHASSTLKSYASDCRIYAAFCERLGALAFPAAPGMVAAFLTAEAQAGQSAATISRRVAALVHFHRAAKLESPVNDSVREVLRGIRRQLGTAPHPKAALLADQVKQIITTIDVRSALATPSMADRRDRALILLGFAGALRRSELAALCVEHTEQLKDGLLLHLVRSKTDQEGKGQEVAVCFGRGAFCPVTALRSWLTAAHIEQGPIFRAIIGDSISAAALDTSNIARMIKRRAAAAGIDPSNIAGHSLRSGFITSAALKGASLLKIAEVSRHRKLDNLRGYFRSDLWQQHAGRGLLEEE